MNRRLPALCLLFIISILPLHARAQSAGGACSTSGQIISTPGDTRGSLICNGSTYEVYEYVTTGPLKKGIGTASPASALDVNGGIKIGADAVACGSTKEGTIRYVTASDSYEFCNGSAWSSLSAGASSGLTFPLIPFTDPTTVSFSWVNQGSGTVETTTIPKSIYFEIPGGQAGDSLRLREITAPATPYKITVFIIPFSTYTNHWVGMCFRESSSGKLQCLHQQNQGSFPNLSVISWTNTTTWSATPWSISSFPSTYPIDVGAGYYMRLEDDGTNRKYSISADGANFYLLYSVGRTSFLTADRVGLMLNTFTAAGSLGVRLLSWKQE